MDIKRIAVPCHLQQIAQTWLPQEMFKLCKETALFVASANSAVRILLANSPSLFHSCRMSKHRACAYREFVPPGDMVVFLKDGSKLEMTGVDRVKEMQEHVEKFIV